MLGRSASGGACQAGCAAIQSSHTPPPDGAMPYAAAISGGVATAKTSTRWGIAASSAGSRSAWITRTLAPQSRRMSPASAALRCQLIGTE